VDVYKVCPACKLAAVLEAPICVQCRHRFRMPFDGSEETTTLGPDELYTGVGEVTGLLRALVVALLLVLGGAVWWLTHR
jgi:hypothetical protein